MEIFAESSSGIGALGFSGQAFLIQLITFLLAFWVLKRYAFGPILKALDRRRETIDKSVTLAEELHKQEEALAKQVEKTMQDARAAADGIIADAQEASRQVVREAEDKARNKAEGIMKTAEQRIASDTKRARKQLEGELVGLISEATEAIIGEKVDARKDAALIDRALKEQRA